MAPFNWNAAAPGPYSAEMNITSPTMSGEAALTDAADRERHGNWNSTRPVAGSRLVIPFLVRNTAAF